MTSSSTELNPWLQNVCGNSTEEAAPTSPWEKTTVQLGWQKLESAAIKGVSC